MWNWILLEKMGIELLIDIFRLYVFLFDDGFKFIIGYSICIVFIIFSIIVLIIYGFVCWNDNRWRDVRIGEDYGFIEDEKVEMGDYLLEYRYFF